MLRAILIASGLFACLLVVPVMSQAATTYVWRGASGVPNYGTSCPAHERCKEVGRGRKRSSTTSTGTGSTTTSTSTSGTTSTHTTTPTTSTTTTSGTTVTPSGILWSADNETGNLSQYDNGGMVFRAINWKTDTTGTVIVENAQEQAHSGQRSVKLSIPSGNPTGPEGVQAQLIRWEESKTNPELYYSVWLYFPQRYNVAPARGGWFNLIQFHAVGGGTRSIPVALHLERQSSTSENNFKLYNDFLGSQPIRSMVPVPIGRWFNVEVRLRRAANSAGLVQIWLDGVEIFNLPNVQTASPETTHHEFYTNVYGWNITPSPATIYADDMRISKTRIWQ